MKPFFLGVFLRTALAGVLLLMPVVTYAEEVHVIDVSIPASEVVVPASTIVQQPVEIFPLVPSGSFAQDALFEVPIAINTRGSSVNTLQFEINFNPKVLSIVKPSAGNSIVNLWLETPTYNNTTGTVKLTGFVRNGIITSSGVVTTLTFKAVNTGVSNLTINPSSEVLLNDGYGSKVKIETVRGVYTVLPKLAGAVHIYSDTHPFSGQWYANKNPVFAWDQQANVTGYSVELDDKPNTTPDEVVDTEAPSFAYQDVPDGVSYFHVRPLTGGRWGEVSHFQVRIDTTPPAEFIPTVAKLKAGGVDQTQLTFFTTDELSGFDHFEIGVSDSARVDERPLFVQTESPHILEGAKNVRVIVRAFDTAGNIRDVQVSFSKFGEFFDGIKDNLLIVLLVLVGLFILFIVLHYLLAHHVVAKAKELMVLPASSLPPPSVPPQP